MKKHVELHSLGLTPDCERALQTLLARAGACDIRPTITSGRRSAAKQKQLWDARATNPYPVAPPGTSSHERGIAFDLSASQNDLRKLGDIWEGMGGHWGGRFERFDPIHFEWRKGAAWDPPPKTYTTT